MVTTTMWYSTWCSNLSPVPACLISVFTLDTTLQQQWSEGKLHIKNVMVSSNCGMTGWAKKTWRDFQTGLGPPYQNVRFMEWVSTTHHVSQSPKEVSLLFTVLLFLLVRLPGCRCHRRFLVMALWPLARTGRLAGQSGSGLRQRLKELLWLPWGLGHEWFSQQLVDFIISNSNIDCSSLLMKVVWFHFCFHKKVVSIEAMWL